MIKIKIVTILVFFRYIVINNVIFEIFTKTIVISLLALSLYNKPLEYNQCTHVFFFI